jgi:uncharacterized protein (TIGR00369 family)
LGSRRAAFEEDLVTAQLSTDHARGLFTVLGLHLEEATGDRVVITWTIGPEHQQPYGIVHGGVYCSAVETAASIGAALWLGERGQVVGVSNQTDFLRAVREGVLTATANPVHRGRLQQLWDVDITDESGRLVSRGQVRLQNIEAADRLAAPAPAQAPDGAD